MHRILLLSGLLLAPLAAEVERRTLNNGNLILEDVPEIPGQLVDELQQFTL